MFQQGKMWQKSSMSMPGARGRKVLLAVLALLLLWVVFMPGHGLLAYLRLQRDYSGIVRENEALTRQNSALREEIAALRSDDKALEQVARARHGLLKPNEIVYEISPAAAKEHKALPEPPPEEEGPQPGDSGARK
ncbi:MAG: hypothetical protein BWK76_02585 [Desulfobulbaceae bacterium A2]|nr:MAG: hypothetical protein BWK76_02585 [Desulfobulbaceae bacterium A2]